MTTYQLVTTMMMLIMVICISRIWIPDVYDGYNSDNVYDGDVDAVDDGDDVEEGEKLIGSESGELLS